ncbi:MAG: amidohydrolase family protein [Alphaproteobacteria bacterium]
MAYDLKILNGIIVDGTGDAGRMGDVGVREGKIVALGTVLGPAEQTLDALGKVVCPGFVDVHTHYDAQLLWDRAMSISPWHGVTTVVIGNCGFGVAPTRPTHRDLILRTLEKVEGMSADALRAGLGEDWGFKTFPEYLDLIERQGIAINVGVLLGHTPIRLEVMGEDAVRRAATPEEISEMSDIIREGMYAGALGFATSHAPTHHGFGGHPVPSRLAPMEELDELVGTMAESRRGILQATVGRTLFHEEFRSLASHHDIPITWTALLAGMSGPGSHRRHQAQALELIKDGLNVVPQISCRPLNFDFDFNDPFVFQMRPLFGPTMKTDREGRRRIYSDPDFRAAFKKDSVASARNPLAGWMERAVISLSPGQEANEERPLVDVAAEQGVTPIDLALDLSLKSDFGARFRFPVVNFDEEEVEELLRDPNMLVALSDAGAHASQLCDACYSTHLLGHWVREKGVLELERAIHMLTLRPAEVFGIMDRGLLAVGRPADIVTFDPDTVKAGSLRRVRDLPGGADRLVADAVGIAAVVVNGTVIRQNGEDRENGNRFPGRLLRGGAAA